MAKFKHLTFKDRSIIQSMLNDKYKFSQIATTLEKDLSTISKEVRSHIVIENKGGLHKNFNACANRFSCTKSHVCVVCDSVRKYKLCKSNLCDESGFASKG